MSSSARVQIEVADLAAPDVVELIRLHGEGMEANSPPGACHYFDQASLSGPDVTVFAIREDDRLMGIGALREIDATHGEIKSMRTAEDFLGRGVGRRVLDHLIDVAASRGYSRLLLETGTTPAFAAACRLYETSGFERCDPFDNYEASDFSRFYSLALENKLSAS